MLISALCDSDRAEGNGMELSGEGSGVRERFCTRGHNTKHDGVQEAFRPCSKTKSLNFG